MSRIQFARSEHKNAPLYSDFAKEFVKRHFGEETTALIYALLPVYSKGKRAGQLKGFVHWDKVGTGGWVRGDARERGHVVRPGTRNVYISAGYDDATGKIEAGDKCEVETVAAYHLRICRALPHIFKTPRRPFGSPALAAKTEELLAIWTAERAAKAAAIEREFQERVEADLAKYGVTS